MWIKWILSTVKIGLELYLTVLPEDACAIGDLISEGAIGFSGVFFSIGTVCWIGTVAIDRGLTPAYTKVQRRRN